VAREDVDLAIERQVVGVLGRDDLGEELRAGVPLSIGCAGRGLVTTDSSKPGQAYLKRTGSVTNSEAG
jgi:hypothetical protein